MTQSATIGQPCADGAIGVEVANSIAFVWSLALRLREFALEELPPTPNRAIGIASDNVD
jgi:hypothetical protein